MSILHFELVKINNIIFIASKFLRILFLSEYKLIF